MHGNYNWQIVIAWKLDSYKLQIVLTKQQNNKKEKYDKTKEVAINSKENIESLLCKVNFVDNYNWKIKIIESLRTKITESYKIKIAKSCLEVLEELNMHENNAKNA